MGLTIEDVKKVAKLSRLALSEEEEKENLEVLNRIFGLIEKMQSIDTDGVEPLSHPHEVAQRLREDVVTETNLREDNQSIAPLVQEGLYLVPKVIE